MNFLHIRELREILHDIYDLYSFDIFISKLVCSCSFFFFLFDLFNYVRVLNSHGGNRP